MSRVAYVSGRYRPQCEAAVHIEDRGYQFGDGVYEVIAVTRGRLVDEERHLARLHRSLTELRINPPMSDAALKVVMREVRPSATDDRIDTFSGEGWDHCVYYQPSATKKHKLLVFLPGTGGRGA